MLQELMLGKDGGKVRSVDLSVCHQRFLGTRPNGETGLFPEAYVEEVQEEGPPAMAPPPLPQVEFNTFTDQSYR